MEWVLREYFAEPAPAADLLRAYEVQCEALWAQSFCVNPESVCVVRTDEPAYFRFMSLLVAMKVRGVRPARKTLAEIRAARLPVMPLDDWGPLTDELLLKSAAAHPAAAAAMPEEEWARVNEYVFGPELAEAGYRVLCRLQERLQGGDDSVAARHDLLLNSLRALESDPSRAAAVNTAAKCAAKDVMANELLPQGARGAHDC